MTFRELLHFSPHIAISVKDLALHFRVRNDSYRLLIPKAI